MAVKTDYSDGLLGDITHLTLKQVQTIIGPGAKASEPGGANWMRVAAEAADKFRPFGTSAGTNIPEYIIDGTVNVGQNIEMIIH